MSSPPAHAAAHHAAAHHAAAHHAAPAASSTRLASAIVATTQNPMDYLTNARGSTRPNAFAAANTCYSSHTIGMTPAEKASTCASMSANSLYEAAQRMDQGLFLPPHQQ